MVRIKQTAKRGRTGKNDRHVDRLSPPASPASPSSPPPAAKKKKSTSNDSVSRTRLKILWMLEFITDSEIVPWSLKVEYANIASEQLREDDASLGIPRVLRIRMLVEEMKYICGEDGANWDWQERSLKLYPILLKILYTMDLKGEEKLDERMRPHKKIMALALVSHMVQLLIERQLNEFICTWESQTYAELKEMPQGKMDGVREELNILDGIGRYLNTVASMYRKQHGFNLDTYGGDDITRSPGKQLQMSLTSTADNCDIYSGYHFKASANELLKELRAYYKRAKVALGPTFLQEASTDILHEKYSPDLDEEKLLIQTNKDLERNVESIEGGRVGRELPDENLLEETPNRISTPKSVNIFGKGW